MRNRVEPPVLISRLITFVLAAALVVLGVLCITVMKLFPLNRPQIFFLSTEQRDEQIIKLIEMPPASKNLDKYKKEFIREYIRHRNEVYPNANVMQKKWNTTDGIVRVTSTDSVFADFMNTNMFFAIMSNMPDFEFRCDTSFLGTPMLLRSDDPKHDTYQVDFRYFCSDSTGQTNPKNYTIKIKLATDDEVDMKWVDRIANPLGLRVEEYEIVSENGDPLNTGYLP
ncbi:MAG: VirB8/TrbF family protein [Alphaproteobacteria bacterium]|nr:VirB8/TrbF family protein [Alphaproteobacteria bacterium]